MIFLEHTKTTPSMKGQYTLLFLMLLCMCMNFSLEAKRSLENEDLVDSPDEKDENPFGRFTFAEENPLDSKSNQPPNELPITAEEIADMLQTYKKVEKQEKHLKPFLYPMKKQNADSRLYYNKLDPYDRRDAEFMHQIFDVYDDDMFEDMEDKKKKLKELQNEPIAVKEFKGKIRKIILGELVQKMFPNNEEAAKNLYREFSQLKPQNLFKAAVEWGVIKGFEKKIFDEVSMPLLRNKRDLRDYELSHENSDYEEINKRFQSDENGGVDMSFLETEHATGSDGQNSMPVSRRSDQMVHLQLKLKDIKVAINRFPALQNELKRKLGFAKHLLDEEKSSISQSHVRKRPFKRHFHLSQPLEDMERRSDFQSSSDKVEYHTDDMIPQDSDLKHSTNSDRYEGDNIHITGVKTDLEGDLDDVEKIQTSSSNSEEEVSEYTNPGKTNRQDVFDYQYDNALDLFGERENYVSDKDTDEVETKDEPLVESMATKMDVTDPDISYIEELKNLMTESRNDIDYFSGDDEEHYYPSKSDHQESIDENENKESDGNESDNFKEQDSGIYFRLMNGAKEIKHGKKGPYNKQNYPSKPVDHRGPFGKLEPPSDDINAMDNNNRGKPELNEFTPSDEPLEKKPPDQLIIGRMNRLYRPKSVNQK